MQKYVEEEQSILWTVALRANKINRNEFIESYLVAYCVLCKKRDCYGFTATILLFQSQKLLGFDEETSMYILYHYSLSTTLNRTHTTTTSIYYTTVFSDDFQGYEVMENAFLLKEQPHVLMHSIALSVSSFIRFKVF